MLVVFDTTFLIPLLDPQLKGTSEVDARISHLAAMLDRQKSENHHSDSGSKRSSDRSG